MTAVPLHTQSAPVSSHIVTFPQAPAGTMHQQESELRWGFHDTRVRVYGLQPWVRAGDVQLTLLTLPESWCDWCLWVPSQVESMRHSCTLEYLPQWLPLTLYMLIYKARARNHDIKIIFIQGQIKTTKFRKLGLTSSEYIRPIDKRVQMRLRIQGTERGRIPSADLPVKLGASVALYLTALLGSASHWCFYSYCQFFQNHILLVFETRSCYITQKV